MKTAVKRIMRDEKGKALVLALVLLVVGGLILTPLLGLMTTGLAAGQVYEKKTAELYAADAGVEDAINWLLHGKPIDWGWEWDGEAGTGYRATPLGVNDKDVDVTVEALVDPNTYKVTSVATSPEGSTTVLSTLWAIHWIKGCYEVGENDTFYGDIYVEGDVTAVNLGQIVGTVTLSGNLDLDNNSTLEGDASVDGNIVLDNNSTISGTIICVTGNITLSSNSDITADIRFLGADCTLTISAPDAFVTGNIWADGNLTIDILTGNAAGVEITGDVYAPQGTVDVHLNKNNSELEGDIYAGGSISITGNGDHTGTAYPDYTGDPPFEIADCPGIPVTPIEVLTYEVV